jgi:hypothetical protein
MRLGACSLMFNLCNQIFNLICISEYQSSKAFLIVLKGASFLINDVVLIESDIPAPDDGIHLRNPHAVLIDTVIANESSNNCARLKFMFSYLFENQDVSLRPYNAEI